MKIGICDDVKSFCDELEQYITAFLNEQGLSADLVQYGSAAALLNDKEPCDILFLDLELGDSNGLEVLEEIKAKHLRTIVLVVTAFPKYMDDAMNYRILRFIEKPVEKQRIEQAIKKAISILNEDFIVIHDLKTKSDYRLFLRDIICAETKLRKIYIYTVSQSFVLREGFKALKEKLHASYFVEAHYSYVVNMNFIKCFKRTQIVIDIGGKDKIVPVSGEKQALLRKRYAAFLGEDYAI